MSFLNWITGKFSSRGRALAPYRSGMAKAKKKDYQGAIVDYTTVIESSSVPPDVKAMASYNRSLAYAAIEEYDKAAADLTATLSMPNLPENIKVQAQQRKKRVQNRAERKEGQAE